MASDVSICNEILFMLVFKKYTSNSIHVVMRPTGI